MKKMGVTDEEKKQGKAPKNILKVHREENFSKKNQHCEKALLVNKEKPHISKNN